MIVYVLLSVSVKSSLYLGLHCLNKSALGFSLRSPPVDHSLHVEIRHIHSGCSNDRTRLRNSFERRNQSTYKILVTF